MNVIYLRSSSIGTFGMCEADYFFTYELGLDKPSGKAAAIGNCTHKTLEVLSRYRLAELRGEPTFVDPETSREFRREDVTIDLATQYGWDVYVAKEKTLSFTKADLSAHKKAVSVVLNSDYNPLGLEVVAPEQFFDITIPDDWARYSFVDIHTGKTVEGQLAIRGTVDLVYRSKSRMLAYCDWKTGRRVNWRTREEKSVDKLHKDDQLWLYYVALRHLYPDDRDIAMTIFYTKDGGPFNLFFTSDYRAKALEMVKDRFEKMRATALPSRALDDDSLASKPCSFCHYNKTQWSGSRKSVCDYIYEEVVNLGTDRVALKYGKQGHSSNYGSGGGVSSETRASRIS